MKIAVISDLHLGFRQYGSLEREQDFYDQFHKVCKKISEYEPNMVIIAGDLFNKPNPTPAAINAYREGIGSLNADIICTIKGNHTMVLRDDHYSIDEFFGKDEFDGYYYLDDQSITTHGYALDSPYDAEFSKYKKLPNIQVDGVTYRNNSSIDEFLVNQRQLAAKTTGDYNLLIVHQAFKEFCGFTGEELSIEDIDYGPYDVVICGHIHSRMHTELSDGTWFVQPGSIERMNVAEALDEQRHGKGFYMIDTDENSVKFHRIECDRKFFLGNIKLDNEEDLNKHVSWLNETVKKLKVQPIISYDYQSNIKNIALVRDMLGEQNENVLLNKSNIDDLTQKDIIVEITDSEVPTILEAIKSYANKNEFKEDEVKLITDIYQNDDIENVLDNYYKKNEKEYTEDTKKEYEEIKDIEEYFEG